MTGKNPHSSMDEKLAEAKKIAEYFRDRAKHGDLDAALAMLDRKGGVQPQAGDEIL